MARLERCLASSNDVRLPDNSFVHLGYNGIDAVAASALPHYLADELKLVKTREITEVYMRFA